jgi:hypothetical protein
MNSRRRRQVLIWPSCPRESYRGSIARHKHAVLTFRRGGFWTSVGGRGWQHPRLPRRPPKARFGGPGSGRPCASTLMSEMGHQLACSGRGYLVRSCLGKRTLPGLAAAPCGAADWRGLPNVRLPYTKAAFGPQGRFSQLSARSGLYVERQRASRRVQHAGRLVPQNGFSEGRDANRP